MTSPGKDLGLTKPEVIVINFRLTGEEATRFIMWCNHNDVKPNVLAKSMLIKQLIVEGLLPKSWGKIKRRGNSYR